MPFIGNGIKSKETGKSGVKTEFTSLFITFHKMVYKIGSGKGSLSTGPKFHRLGAAAFFELLDILEAGLFFIFEYFHI